jgi:hypothetical protein
MPEDWEIVKIVGTEEEATIVVGFLQSSGIEAQAESLHASEFPTDFGDLAQVRIRVPAEQAQDAKTLLNQREDVATGDEGDMAGAPLEEGMEQEETSAAATLDPSQAKP